MKRSDSLKFQQLRNVAHKCRFAGFFAPTRLHCVLRFVFVYFLWATWKYNNLQICSYNQIIVYFSLCICQLQREQLKKRLRVECWLFAFFRFLLLHHHHRLIPFNFKNGLCRSMNLTSYIFICMMWIFSQLLLWFSAIAAAAAALFRLLV